MGYPRVLDDCPSLVPGASKDISRDTRGNSFTRVGEEVPRASRDSGEHQSSGDEAGLPSLVKDWLSPRSDVLTIH